MKNDFIAVARKRRLSALEVLKRRQPALPGLAKAKMAPLQPDPSIVPFRERIVYQLKTS